MKASDQKWTGYAKSYQTIFRASTPLAPFSTISYFDTNKLFKFATGRPSSIIHKSIDIKWLGRTSSDSFLSDKFTKVLTTVSRLLLTLMRVIIKNVPHATNLLARPPFVIFYLVVCTVPTRPHKTPQPTRIQSFGNCLSDWFFFRGRRLQFKFKFSTNYVLIVDSNSSTTNMIRIRITSIGLLLLLVSLHQGLYPVTALDSDTNCVENGTRAHLTRCDKYFQCLILPSQRIIWVSKQCDEGLIYDEEHGKCVLPNLDWECNLGDDGAVMVDPDHPAPDHSKEHDQENVYGVNNFDDDYIGRSDESSGGEEVTDSSIETLDGNGLQSSSEEEFSGDGTVATTEVDYVPSSSTEAVSMEMPITPDRDGTVKSYLQRLTQLIDGFRRNGASDTEITPDQLNSFVIMHKIKNGNRFRPTGTELLPESGKILKPHLDYILQKQNSLNTVNNLSTDPPKPVRRRIIHIIRPYHRPEPQDNTNILVKSQLGNGSDNQTGLSNSQIVVNRPEGSVLFNIARPVENNEAGRPQIISDVQEPSISEDTLKSVLELSKQLVSHQKYLVEKPNYLPPVVQPVYYNFPVPMVQSSTKPQNVPQIEVANSSFVPQSINSLQSPPVRLQSVKYPQNQVTNKYEGVGYPGTTYQNSPEPFKQHEKYSSPSSSSHEQGNNNYVPLRPINLYQSGASSEYSGQNSNNYHNYQNYNSISNSHKNKYNNGYYQNNQNPYQNQNYNTGYYSNSNQNPNQYYNPNQMMYNSHQPPYYDGTGMGQANPQSYYKPNYPNQPYNQMGQYSQSPADYYSQNNMIPVSSSSSSNHHHHHSHHSHPVASAEQNDEFDSVEMDEGNESEDYSSSSSWERPSKPVKKHSEESTESKPMESPLSSLQLLSQQLMMDNSVEGGGNKNKIVGINGNYMSYDTYKETIAPLLNTDIQGQSNLEVIACTAGIRHQNSSDCTRYYVCNPKTGSLLGYTCPPFTAFNQMTRICDANSYALCKPSLISTRFTIAENKRLQYEAQKALQDAKRIREQALQAQKMAEFIRLKAEEDQAIREKPDLEDAAEEKPIRHRITLKRPSQQGNRVTAAGSHRPSLLSSLGNSNKNRKRYKCLDVGQAIPDVDNHNKYFMCFRDSEGRFKRRSMSCAKGLVFCRAKRMCTLKTRC